MILKINSDSSLSEGIGALRAKYKADGYVTMTLNSGKKRTIKLNTLSHRWYKQVSAETMEYLPIEVKSLCKLHVGIPLLLGLEDDEKSEEVVKLCDFYEAEFKHMAYEKQLIFIEYIPITSLMSTTQFIEYLTGVQYNYARRSVILYWPDEWEEFLKTSCNK